MFVHSVNLSGVLRTSGSSSKNASIWTTDLNDPEPARKPSQKSQPTHQSTKFPVTRVQTIFVPEKARRRAPETYYRLPDEEDFPVQIFRSELKTDVCVCVSDTLICPC